MVKNIKKLNDYLYKVTYDSITETEPEEVHFGSCSSYVADGKLYRNLDWDFNDDISFIIDYEDFTGMAFGHLKNVDSLPYKMVDGVNKYGIMVSTHILYNDWEWDGQGSIPLYKIPYIVLSTMQSIDDIENLPLNNLCSYPSLQEIGYLAQYIISDGETTYVVTPDTESNNYIYVNISENPKLANFKWVSDQQVTRDMLQLRPTGVERWNLMPCELSELRFTKAYESPDRLSEFIGINGTTKDSTDEELLSVYNIARQLYLERTRDGSTWQTMHSVVYSADGMEHLYIQENWEKDYSEENQMRRIKHKDFINEEMAEYYVESEAELDEIPDDALEGSVAMVNSPGGFKVLMKDSNGNWNEL